MLEKARIALKSITLTTSELVKVCKLVQKVERNDNKSKNYKRAPIFMLDSTDGSGYTTSDPNEFKDALNNSLEKIAFIKLYYSGYDTNIDFYFSKLGSLTLNIESTKKTSLLLLKDEFTHLTSSQNNNWVFHTFWGIVIVIPISIQLIIALFIYSIPFQFLDTEVNIQDLPIKIRAIIANSFPFLILPFYFMLPNIYPKLVIKNQKKANGRVINEDFKWLVGILIFSILLPLLINILTK